uniref:CSON002444 protein n=1 Tax=Culicoides sonorensis TaxID=179676 RepID=A0A336MMT5_CULSO
MAHQTINNYIDLIQNISASFEDENSKDVCFTFRDSSIKLKAHKFLLETASPVFKTMLSGNFREKFEVKIDDIRPHIFELLLSGIYLKEINFKNNDVKVAADLYNAAEKYDIQNIRDICVRFMLKKCLSPYINFIYNFARVFDLELLQDTCENKFRDKTYAVCSEFLKTKSLKDDILVEFLGLEDLFIKSEFDLYMTVEILVETKRLSSYSKSLSQIRFLSMDMQKVLSCDLLSFEEKCRVLSNIDGKRNYVEPIMQMPEHLSKETEPRCFPNHDYDEDDSRYCFWITILLICNDFDKHLSRFFHFIEPGFCNQDSIKSFLTNQRQNLANGYLTKVTVSNILSEVINIHNQSILNENPNKRLKK